MFDTRSRRACRCYHTALSLRRHCRALLNEYAVDEMRSIDATAIAGVSEPRVFERVIRLL